MKRSRFITRLLACIMTCGAALAIASGKPEKLLVMLQGSSAAELGELVRVNGGTVTHDLHIINAVGASLTQAQLDEVLKSPLIIRHIDDLSVSESPDEKPDEDAKTCDVKGSLELEIGESDISWALYNKLPEPAVLESLVLKWPKQLGSITEFSLNEIPIDVSSYNNRSDSSLDIKLTEFTAPRFKGTANLKATFKSSKAEITSRSSQQKDFSIEATFQGGCSVILIPGYDKDHEHYYHIGLSGVNALHKNGVTGKGITVAVLDSGLWEHDSITRDTLGEPRVIARYNAITDSSGKEIFDESGHGTHMTSVLAQSAPILIAGTPTGSFKGVAPDASLVIVKAFDVQGRGDLLDILRALQWVVDNRINYNIRVLNLSFAARPRWHYWEDPINQAVMLAWANGITVVAAAGNEGPDQMTIGSPGNLPYIITVGAMTDSWTVNTRDDDYIPDFSSRGPTPSAHIKPDIVAPGGHISGLTRPGSSLTKKYPEYIMSSTGDFVMTGSSQATALVSGIVALLLQLEPKNSPDDIKCKLTSSAEPAINNDGLLAYSPFIQGHGQVSATRAVTLGMTGCGNTDIDIKLELSGDQHFQGPAIIDQEGKTSLPGLQKMVSSVPSEKGISQIRKWGVKAHIERTDPPPLSTATPSPTAFNWRQIYLEEKAAIETLAEDSLK